MERLKVNTSLSVDSNKSCVKTYHISLLVIFICRKKQHFTMNGTYLFQNKFKGLSSAADAFFVFISNNKAHLSPGGVLLA